MSILNALETIYQSDPCGVLANPLWKMEPILETCACSIQKDTDGQISHLEAWKDGSLHLYWDADWVWRPTVPEETWRQPDFAVINSRYAAQLSLTPDYIIQRLFRLKFAHLDEISPLPPGFSFKLAELPAEAGLVAQVIGRSYVHMRPDLDNVIRWMQQPVFDPSLWIWIIDERTHQPAGLGIAEFDHPRGEASLEWIQVLPEFRGNGLAKALVTRMLGQLVTEAKLVTVSGEADNPSDSEYLYRRCGFTGKDVWWILTRLGG